MNILTYNLCENSTEIIDVMSMINGVSMYFAISREDMVKKAAEIQPDIILVGEDDTIKISDILSKLTTDAKVFQFRRI
jgi:hypothetical protein